jgi:hypothetical protein
MTEYGVRRLVAINSGNYSYAEIDLSKPVHLAAPNNRGKSTLVNSLQFLYIDDFNRMKFGRRSHDDTRKHYFGGDRSYLVFECLTTSGIQCMLVRGLGNLRGGSFERYVYDGEYHQADFLDDGEIRDFDDVKTRLANRHLARVKNSDLWQVLAGSLPSNDGKAIPRLNILPIRRRDEYLAFRDVFVRLLSLTNADARTLRQLIIESHARDVGERKIDVASEYKEEFDRAERSEHELQFVTTVAGEIDKARELRLEIQSLTDKFSATAPAVWSDARRCHRFIESDTQRLSADVTRISLDRKSKETQKDKCIDESIGLRADLTVIEREWAALMTAREKWSAYSPAFIRTMRDNAQRKATEIAELQQNLDQAETLNIEAMRRRVAQLRRQIATDHRVLDRWEKTAVAELRRTGIAETDIENAFRIINPDLLKLIVGDSLTVKDATTSAERIRTIARRIKGGAYSDDSVEVDLTSVAGPDSDTLGDPQLLSNHIALNEQDLVQQGSRLKTAEDQESARTTLAELKEEYATLSAELAEHDAYAKAWSERKNLEKRLANAKNAVDEIQQQISELQRQVKSLTEDEKRVERELASLKEKKTQLSRTAREFGDEAKRLALDAILPIDAEDDADEDARPKALSRFVDSVTARLAALTNDLRRIDSGRAAVKQLQVIISEKSRQFETQERYFNDEDEEWQRLIESRDSLTQLEEVTKRNWDGLFTTLGARLNAIVTAVSSIKTAVERINRGLKAYRVSNLREVHIKVEEQHDVFPAVEALSSQGSLFQDRDAVEIAKRRLRQMIERNEMIELETLFELRIQIEEADGTLHQAASLDEIGSTGTGMTAKAMIFVQLVRAIAANDNYRLHFYMDGLGELDDHNLAATAGMAVSRGIIPITADPRLHLEPLAHPEVTVYSLGQSTDGRFYVDAYKTYYARRRTEATVSSRE